MSQNQPRFMLVCWCIFGNFDANLEHVYMIGREEEWRLVFSNVFIVWCDVLHYIVPIRVLSPNNHIKAYVKALIPTRG